MNYTDLLSGELHLAPYRPGGVRDKVTGNIFVKNLSGETRSIDVFNFFSAFGKIFSCRVKYNTNNQCKGYGYVQFENKEGADKALAEGNGKELKGSKVEVQPFKAREARSAILSRYNNLFVKSIPKKFTNKDMTELFAPYGEIISAVVIKDTQDAKENRGFGFVCFKKVEDARNAEEKLRNHVLEGQSLYICKALSKEDHRRQIREERLKTFKDCNLYVKELPEDINDEKLKKGFEEFGRVLSARVMVEKRTDLASGKAEMKSRGFGFVCFSNKDEARNAMAAASTKQILGRILYVAIAERKEDRVARISSYYMMPFPGPRPGFGMYGMPPPYGYPGAFPRQRRPGYGGRGRGRMYPPAGMPPMVMPMMPPPQMAGQYQAPPPMAMPVPAPEAPVRELPNDKEQLGEYLYPLVEMKNPANAAKITGMLLEMEVDQLQNIIRNPAQLDKWIAEAMKVLAKSEQAA
ncbi:MAG: hypothetical protein P4L10_11225 [Acidobacteriaceae bacterium]|nr:hypothetical protein [Acidobacteriaceae bacterium]